MFNECLYIIWNKTQLNFTPNLDQNYLKSKY